jgi:hypothetical protein
VEAVTQVTVMNLGEASFTMLHPRNILFSFTKMSNFSTELSAASPPLHWRTAKG